MIDINEGGVSRLWPSNGSIIDSNFAGCAVDTMIQCGVWSCSRTKTAVAVCGHQTCSHVFGPAEIVSEICASVIEKELATFRSVSNPGKRNRRRSKLLGFPTSIAFASVETVGRGCQAPLAKYTLIARLA